MNAWASDLIPLAVQHIGKNWGGHGVCVCVCGVGGGDYKVEFEAKGVEGAFRLIIKRKLNWKPKQLFPIISPRTCCYLFYLLHLCR